ncbi:MAG: DUF4815 domain-containing protein, partial [Bacteroidota bacterium]
SEAATVNPPSNTTLNIGSSEKKFPYPGTVLTGTIEYYVGRTDVVTVNKNNTITIKTGTNGEKADKKRSGTNRDSIDISLLSIPAYPTIAQNPSANVQTILDKKIVSERYLTSRVNNKIVRDLISNGEIKESQPKAYKMKDIARIDQRVRNLEYAVSLSLAESQLKNKVIPSSISPDINRFKYGFFIDDFTNNNLSDTKNPEYTSYLDAANRQLHPLTELLNVSLDTGDVYDFPYTEVAIVSQNIATEPVVIVPQPPPPNDDGIVVTPDGGGGGGDVIVITEDGDPGDDPGDYIDGGLTGLPLPTDEPDGGGQVTTPDVDDNTDSYQWADSPHGDPEDGGVDTDDGEDDDDDDDDGDE